MREYLDAEQPAPETFSSALASATRSVIEELSSIAAVRGVRLRLVGTCTATVPVPESRLRLALQYLITTLIEAQPVGSKVTLLLGEGPAGAVLRAEGERNCQQQKLSAPSPQTTLRRVRIAIASRVLESAGASLLFGGSDVDPTGFVLRVPRRVAAQ
jgi:signal transduction histidine kinase